MLTATYYVLVMHCLVVGLTGSDQNSPRHGYFENGILNVLIISYCPVRRYQYISVKAVSHV